MQDWTILELCDALGFNEELSSHPSFLLAHTQQTFDYFENSIESLTPNQQPYLEQARACAELFLMCQPPGFWFPYPQRDSSLIITVLSHIFNWHAVQQAAHRHIVKMGKRKARSQVAQEGGCCTQINLKSICLETDPTLPTEFYIRRCLQNYQHDIHKSTLSELTIEWLFKDSLEWPIEADHRIQYHMHRFNLYITAEMYPDGHSAFHPMLSLLKDLKRGTEIDKDGGFQGLGIFIQRLFEQICYHTMSCHRAGLLEQDEQGVFRKTAIFSRCWAEFEMRSTDMDEIKQSRSIKCNNSTDYLETEPTSNPTFMSNFCSTSLTSCENIEVISSEKHIKSRSSSPSGASSLSDMDANQKFISLDEIAPKFWEGGSSVKPCAKCLNIDHRCTHMPSGNKAGFMIDEEYSIKTQSFKRPKEYERAEACAHTTLQHPLCSPKTSSENIQNIQHTQGRTSTSPDSSPVSLPVEIVNETQDCGAVDDLTKVPFNPFSEKTGCSPSVVRPFLDLFDIDIFIQERPNTEIIFENPIPRESLRYNKTAFEFFSVFAQHAELGISAIALLTIVILPSNVSVVVNRDWDADQWDHAKSQIKSILDDNSRRKELHVYIGDIVETEEYEEEYEEWS